MASPTDKPVASRVWEAAKRISGPGSPNRKEPLTNDVLNDILDLSNILHLRNVYLYVSACAGVFRSEEVLNIRMSHIHFHEGCMIIKVEKSKTDQLQQGHQVVTAQSRGSECPVFLLKTYLRKLDNDPHSSEIIFRALIKLSPPTS